MEGESGGESDRIDGPQAEGERGGCAANAPPRREVTNGPSCALRRMTVVWKLRWSLWGKLPLPVPGPGQGRRADDCAEASPSALT